MAEIGEVFHSTPDARFEMKEHLDYCFTCITKTRKIAALALALTFGVSSFLIFLAGKTAFGFFSLLPIALLLIQNLTNRP